MARRSLRDARILITGASSGLGREMALQLARLSAQLWLTGRDAGRLQQIASRLQCPSTSGDVTEATHRRALYDEIHSHWGALDVLLSCAGQGAIGPFAAASPDRLRQIMDVNFFAPVELTRQFLPLLRLGKRPAVALVGSVLGHCGVPLKSEYCASKHALHGWADAVRSEWSAGGLDVVLINPSTIRTDFFNHVLGDASQQRSVGAITAADAAARSIRAIQRGRADTIFPLTGKALVWLDRCCPWLLRRLLRRG
jgi:short-subunit dehydrogenase